MKLPRISLAFSLALCGALAASVGCGCGGGSTSGATPTPTPTPTPIGSTPTPSPTPTPAPINATGRVRFSDGTNTVESNADGTNKVTIGPARTSGALSPDGTRVVYLGSTYVNGLPELYIENADGTNARRLGVGTRGLKAAWSPDGLKIAYSDRGSPVTVNGVTGSSDELWTINPDGTGAKQVTVSLSAGYGGDFAWSPDGARFVFAAFIAGRQKAYIVNADGSGLRRLNDDDSFAPERDVRWSKSNKIYWRGFSGSSTSLSLYRQNPDGTGGESISGDVPPSIPPITGYAVSPDEKFVVFSKDGDIYVKQIGKEAYVKIGAGGAIVDWR